MKNNEFIRLVGSKVLLVPYEACHVPRYHEWMKSEELQILTASEPLSLEEEFDMQRKWREDDDKCTFIILNNERFFQSQSKSYTNVDEIMEGDVNLFFNDATDRSVAEIEIMIAEPAARGKGHGQEALLMMMRYGIEDLHVKTFVAKIGYNNNSSLNMFGKLGFSEVSRCDVFQEVTLNLFITSDSSETIRRKTIEFRQESTR